MRAVAILPAVLGILSLTPASSAETQVKAEDCSTAVSGTMIGSHIEVHCLSKEDIARVIDELVRQGVVRRAEDAGIERSVIVSLAARLKPTEKLDFAQAVVEVSHAVDVAIGVVAVGTNGSNDNLVDEVVKRVAEKTKANDPIGATREAEEGFSRWEEQESERRANVTIAGVALLETALKTDLLRFDAAAAAGRIEKLAALQNEGNLDGQFEAVRTRLIQFYAEGGDKSVNFSLEVAVAIARRSVALARGPDQRGMALNDLGITLDELGERESGTSKLDEAVTTYHAALEERTRERVPLDWAQTQMNLGNALVGLGERESGTSKLDEAVKAYLAALLEEKRERVPLDWAQTQLNLGNALARLGERESGASELQKAVTAYRAVLDGETRKRAPVLWALAQNNLGIALMEVGKRDGDIEKLKQAVQACLAALQERRRDRVPLDWAMTQNNLGNTLATLGERESEPPLLDAAVHAYRAALEERTRERVPLYWAQTQHNLGLALTVIGEGESGVEKLDAASAAYGEALKERTRERVPLDWAASFGNQGVVMMLIADRTGDGALAEVALRQITTAYEATQSGGQELVTAYLKAQLPKAQAIRERLKDK
jgi:tetratricopeptide (TPR) repeat protein